MRKIKRLPETLKRNGITYKMIMRNDRVALWELFIHGKCVGFEVSVILLRPERKTFGKIISARESLPPDSWFGVLDKSKCFFPDEFERGISYLEELTIEMEMKGMVNTPPSVDKQFLKEISLEQLQLVSM